jgi:inorganic pyrophosphatase
VLTERPITHGAILVRARPIGGLRLLDRGEADDKIIAVLVDDPAYGAFRDLADAPAPLVDRLRHYFLTYKDLPDASAPRTCEISAVYGAAGAHEVIRAAIADYAAGFPAVS